MHRRSSIAARAVVSSLLLAACSDPVHPPASLATVPGIRRATIADAQKGRWGPRFAWPIIAVHLSVLPDGKVLSWTSNDLDHQHNTPNVYIWDPAQPNAAQRQVPNTRTDLFCSAHTFLPSGDLLIAGGHLRDDSGVKDANIFQSQSGTWRPGGATAMIGARWYPSAVPLGNGGVLVLGGYREDHSLNQYPEVYVGNTAPWRLLAGAPLVMPWYPWIFTAPGGRVFLAGPDPLARFLNPAGTGEWTDVGNNLYGESRDRGSAAMYLPGQVLIVGGGDPPTSRAETIDLNVAGPFWKATGSMRYARRHMNAVLLADGRVLATGGTSGPGFNDDARGVRAAELWNPKTGAWTEMDTMAVARNYHSTAILLPDARVLSAGGGRCGECTVSNTDAQVYSPPYLFNADGSSATRPTIANAPASVGYGQSFTVSTPDAAAIARVTIVRLPSATHSFDMSQRFDTLRFSRAAGQLSVTAPANANLDPPGHYMLFVLNAAGVPSVARVIRIDGTAPLPDGPTAPAAPGGLVASVVRGQQLNLQWADPSNAESGFNVERCVGVGCTTFTQIDTTEANVVRYANAGLSAGTSYSYRVRARNSGGYSGYSNVVTATPSATAPAGTVVHRQSGRCMDVWAVNEANGAEVTLYDCLNAVNQKWTPPPAAGGPMKVYDYQCLDVYGAVGRDGDPIVIWSCHGGGNQRWTLTAAGELKGINAKCLDVKGGSTDNGTRLMLAPCSGGASQKWDIAGAAIPANTPPVATYAYSCAELTCNFDSRSSSGDVVARSWAFGDGGTATVVAPLHSYARAGVYQATLTVTDDIGQRAIQTRSITVNRAPLANFTSACVDLACTFADGSSDPDGGATITRWSWSFGDGGTSAARNAAHTYASGGTYTVALTVTDELGGTSTASRTITATLPAVAGQPLVSRASGKCLDVLGALRAAGTPVVIYPCHTGDNQKFAVPAVGASGEIRVYGTMCLEPASVARGAATADGDTVVVRACSGTPGQQWTRTATGELRGLGGRCLDVLGARPDDLTTVWLWTCFGADNQRWTVGAPATAAHVARPASSALAPPGRSRGAG